MAKKPDASPTADDIPAMDYPQHEATYNGFLAGLKWSIIGMGILMVSLYFFIEAHQPLIGALLLLAMPVGAVALLVMRSRNTA